MAADHRISGLGSRTADEAVADGVQPRTVWLALCDDFEVPESRRLGRDRPLRRDAPLEERVRASRPALRFHGGLLGMFIVGGVVGAAGFKYVGFVWVMPLAALLLALSLPPLRRDLRRSAYLRQRLASLGRRVAGRRRPAVPARSPDADGPSFDPPVAAPPASPSKPPPPPSPPFPSA